MGGGKSRVGGGLAVDGRQNEMRAGFQKDDDDGDYPVSQCLSHVNSLICECNNGRLEVMERKRLLGHVI